MREIEIKAKVSDKAALLDRIKRTGITLSSPIKQHDIVYGQEGVAANTPGSIWLRIRTENDTQSIFTLKQAHTGGLDSIEHETEISDANELVSIIELLGFTMYSDLTKTRQKAHYNDIEICVDDVDGLGVFIEAEKLAEIDVDAASVTATLWGELEKLGIDKSNEVSEGYDVLMKRRLSKDK